MVEVASDSFIEIFYVKEEKNGYFYLYEKIFNHGQVKIVMRRESVRKKIKPTSAVYL